MLDDSSSIANNPNIRVHPYTKATFKDAAYSMNKMFDSDSSLPLRPLSYMSFAANFYFADEIISAFKLTNIALHLITGVLIYLLTCKLLALAELKISRTARHWLALITCFIWLTHPLFVSTVLYITQRMTILSALFSVMGAYAFIQYRSDFLHKNTTIWRGIMTVGTCAGCAFFSKENGILLIVYCLVIELVFFRFKFHSLTSLQTKLLYCAILLLPVAGLIVYLIYHYIYLLNITVVTRAFTVDERLMTEMRILWHYIGYLLMLDADGISFYHDNIRLSKNLFNPISTFISLTAWLSLLSLSIYCLFKDKARIVSFAILWYLSGHLLESTVLMLELAFEHRNYAPGISIILLAVTSLYYFFRLFIKESFRAILWLALLSLSAPLLTYPLVDAWKTHSSLTQESYRRAPDSPRVLFQLANISLKEQNLVSMHQYLDKAKSLEPYESAYYFFEIAQACATDQPPTESLLKETLVTLNEGVHTVFTFNQFNAIMTHCNTNTYDALLMSVYMSTAKSGYKRLAANALLMMARVSKRTGDDAAYRELLAEAQRTSSTYELRKEVAVAENASRE